MTDHEQAERLADRLHAEIDRQANDYDFVINLEVVEEAEVMLRNLAAQLAEAQDSLKALRGLIDTLHAEKREIQAQLAERERALNRIDAAVTSGTLADIRRIAREALASLDSAGGAER